MKHLVAFSGGKDSTAMLLMMIEKQIPIDYIVYVDTTKDFPQMYEHIEKVKEYIKPFEITRLEFDFDWYFADRTITKGFREGEKGYGWPDYRKRWCTRLKIWTVKKFIKSIRDYKKEEVVEYMGIAYDEREKREKEYEKRTVKYPLIDWEITEAEALQYCYDRGFDWGGVYEDIKRMSCYCCPIMRLEYLEIIYNKYPELWQKIREMDEKSHRRFRFDFTLENLEKRFRGEDYERSI